MRIDFTKIELQNFGSYEHLDFDIKPGKHLVLGENRSSKTEDSNGSGKSSIYESGIETFFKSKLRGDPSRDGKGNAWSKWSFYKDGRLYAVQRFFGCKGVVNPSLFVDDELLSDRKGRDIEAQIQKILEMSRDIFMSVVVVAQGLPVNFGSQTPTSKKQIIEAMVGFAVWESLRRKNVQPYLKKQSDFYNMVHTTFEQDRENMMRLNSEIDSMTKVMDNLDQDFSNKIKDIKESMLEIVQEYKTTVASLEEINPDGQTVESLSSLIVDIDRKLTVLHRAIDQQQTIADEKTCPTCDRPYPEDKIQSAIEKINAYKGKIEPLKAASDNIRVRLDKTKCTLDTMANLKSNLVMKKREIENITSTQKNIDNSDEISQKREVLQKLFEKVNSLNVEVKEYERKVQASKYLDDLLIPSSQFRAAALERYLYYINYLLKGILPSIIDNMLCELRITPDSKGIELHISRKEKEVVYKSLSGGERRRLDIALILSFQRFLIESSSISTNLLVFDEIFDGLDNLGVVNVLSAIETLFPESSSIYVISHNQQIKAHFDSVVQVIKENDISRVV